MGAGAAIHCMVNQVLLGNGLRSRMDINSVSLIKAGNACPAQFTCTRTVWIRLYPVQMYYWNYKRNTAPVANITKVLWNGIRWESSLKLGSFDCSSRKFKYAVDTFHFTQYEGPTARGRWILNILVSIHKIKHFQYWEFKIQLHFIYFLRRYSIKYFHLKGLFVVVFGIFATSDMNLYELLCITNVLFATGQQHVWESFAFTWKRVVFYIYNPHTFRSNLKGKSISQVISQHWLNLKSSKIYIDST